MLDRVLRGDHKEGLRKLARDAIHSDLALGHRFEEGGLRPRRGAVQLIRQQKLVEDRAGLELELELFLVEDRDAGDIRGQEVGGALHARE